MITKKKVIIIAFSLMIIAFMPLIAIILGATKWIVIAAVNLSLLGVFAISIKNEAIILGAFQIIFQIIKNRLWGYSTNDVIIPLITREQQQSLDDAIKISFSGDLILLREMVDRAYNSDSGEYEFDGMFEHVKDIWKASDLSIGVFEGPMGGADLGYSTSNYGDGIPLALNFPDSFGRAVKEAGIKLVTLANNHMFDIGFEGAERTPKMLDKIGLSHVGLNTNKNKETEPYIINIAGKRIGILAYTYALNGKSEDFFFEDSTKHYIKPVLRRGSKYFKQNLKLVKRDFDKMRLENPDMIIVLPHLGEQFLSAPDKNQRRWCKIFVDLGADIVFADHPHHVQPIEWMISKSGKRSLVVYCPGNFINSYVEHDGDASMIVTAYLSRETLKPFAIGVTPIYAYCKQNNSWIGLPTYKAITNTDIYNSLSRAEYRRINAVNRIVTGIALGSPLDIDVVQKEYISFYDTGMVRIPHRYFDEIKDFTDDLSKLIKSANSICFVGDSITEGTKNGGVGWYEPLISSYPNKKFMRFAKGSQTSHWIVNNAQKISNMNADLYVIAIGCNDIRYRNHSICAMTSSEYIGNLEKAVEVIKSHNPIVKFAFIAPWRSLHFDANFHVKSHSEKMVLYEDYTNALSTFCISNGFLFLNPNPIIFDNITSSDIRVKAGNDILKDFIHPDAFRGVETYCKAVLQCAK